VTVDVNGLVLGPGAGNMIEHGLVNDRELDGIELGASAGIGTNTDKTGNDVVNAVLFACCSQCRSSAKMRQRSL
jgi:hypothetical protein